MLFDIIILCIKVYILIHSLTNGTNTTNSTDIVSIIPKCKRLQTQGYNYNNFFEINGNSLNGTFILKVYIKAPDNGHILLSTIPAPSNEDPVYEIVIGGDRNTFSAIRRMKCAKTTSTVTTLSILSADEYRGFWIEVREDGLISVGKIGNDDQPFMFWRDPELLNIRYYSFATWNDAFGNWAFDCPDQNETNITEVTRPLTDKEKLNSFLFSNYEWYIPPAYDKLLVQLKIIITAINLNDHDGVVTIAGSATLIWYDERLAWDSSKFGYLHEYAGTFTIWKPDLEILNAADPTENIMDYNGGAKINFNGKVTWTPFFQWSSKCDINLKDWPWDTQICEIHLGTHLHNISIIDNFRQLSESSNWGNIVSNWEIVNIKTLNTEWFGMHAEKEDNDNEFIGNMLVIGVTLRRDLSLFGFSLTSILIALCLLLLSCFCVPPSSIIRTIINGLSLLLVSIFLMLMAHLIPEFTIETPSLLISFNVLFLMTGFSSWISICLIYFTQKQHNYPPSKKLLNWLNNRFVSIFLFLPFSKEQSVSYGELDERQEDNVNGTFENSQQRNEVEIAAEHSQKNQIRDDWFRLITAVDHIFLLLYSIFVAVFLSSSIVC